MPDRTNPWVCLGSGDLSVEVDTLGAQLSTLRDKRARDLLWNGDPAVWSGRAPLLFPIVGALAGGTYRVGSASYALPRHGFARGRVFELVDSTADSATLGLIADAASLLVYPFRFDLQVRYVVTGPTLSVVSTIRNTGDIDMPASFGHHPAFRWPLPFGYDRSAHLIEFERAEPAPFRRLNAAGLLTPERHPTCIADRRLVLDDRLFHDDVVIFDAIASRSVTYGAVSGPHIRVDFPDSPYLGVWAKPSGPFVCIEPWHGIADPDGFSGDFADKPGVFRLAPGSSKSIVMAITVNGV